MNYYDFDEFYDESVDSELDEFVDSLKNRAKKEFIDRLNKLEEENARLRDIKENYNTKIRQLENEYDNKKYQLEKEYKDKEYKLYRRPINEILPFYDILKDDDPLKDILLLIRKITNNDKKNK